MLRAFLVFVGSEDLGSMQGMGKLDRPEDEIVESLALSVTTLSSGGFVAYSFAGNVFGRSQFSARSAKHGITIQVPAITFH
jgi:hypothetical protein